MFRFSISCVLFQLNERKHQNDSTSHEVNDLRAEVRKLGKDKSRLEADVRENIVELQELEKRLTGMEQW